MKRVEIPRLVEDTELLVRAIFHPRYCSTSKGKLKPNAFLPAPDAKDVSLLRLLYMDADACKKHALTLHKVDTSAYSGLAVIRNLTIQQFDQAASDINFQVEGTPMDEHKEYVPDGVVVYTDSLGLPAHADLLYDQCQIKGVPNKAMATAARNLSEIANFFLDTDVDSSDWKKGDLTDIKPDGA